MHGIDPLCEACTPLDMRYDTHAVLRGTQVHSTEGPICQACDAIHTRDMVPMHDLHAVFGEVQRLRAVVASTDTCNARLEVANAMICTDLQRVIQANKTRLCIVEEHHTL